ncbi:MAG: DUF397 domain-containing protein [Streptosporangiaceae bacterium]
MRPSDVSSLGELSWRVARHCEAGSCVRIAQQDDMVFVGDTKNPDGPVLAYSLAEWQTFAEGIKRGDFDDFL